MISLIGKALKRWGEDNCPRFGASLSYYLVFSLAPLILLSISIAGLTFGKAEFQAEMISQLRDLLGEHSTAAIQFLFETANRPKVNFITSCLGLAALLLGASGVIVELQDAMNRIWRVNRKAEGIWSFFKHRFFSFLMVIGSGILLLISMLVSAGFSAMGKFMSQLLPMPEFVMQSINLVISFFVITGLFATLYKILPGVRVHWEHVWSGAALASLFFSVGKFLIGLYLGKTTISSTYGAAGTFVMMLVWVYYSAQIFLFGAEYTKLTADLLTAAQDAKQNNKRQRHAQKP